MRIDFHHREDIQPVVSPAQPVMRHARTATVPVLSILFFLGMLALAGGLFYALYEPAEIYTYGIVASDTEVISAPFAGQIASMSMQRGKAVAQGQELLVLTPPAPSSETRAAREQMEQTFQQAGSAGDAERSARVALLQAGVDRLRAVHAEEQIRQEHDIEKAQIEVEKLRVFLRHRRERQEKAQRLVELDAGIQADVDSAAEEGDLAAFNLAQAESDLRLSQERPLPSAAALEEAEVELEQARQGETDAMALDRARFELEQKEKERLPLPITATRPGVALEVNVLAGAYVEAGQTLASLAATDQFWVDVFVPTERMFDVRAGAPVRVYPPGGEAFVLGTVAQVPATALHVPTELQGKFNNWLSAAYVRIELPPGGPLIPGTAVRVVIGE